LLKNFAGLRERTRVLLARNTSGQVASSFETTLANFVTTVVDAYWIYTLAESEFDVARQAVALSTELVRDTERRVNVGTLAPVALSEARADLAARQEQRIRAENALNLAARTLQYRVMYGAIGGAAPEPVRPAERHAVLDQPLKRDEVLRTAIERRPEIRNARLVLDASRMREQVARNDLLPDLSLVGRYNVLGLGGEPVDKDEAESYSRALDRMTSGKYYDYGLGLRVDVPLSNAEARAQHDREVIQVGRDEDQLRQVVSDVALEVERTVGDVISARERVAAAKVARELAQENLRNQRRRYEVGLVTTTDVLQYQDRTIRAMASEVAAIADHARFEALLGRAQGTLLYQYGVDLSYEDTPDLPWWAKF
jgi:outer membrane protein TolC